MKLSTERILTTHAGSLPRPTELATLLVAQEDGESVDTFDLDVRIRRAVEDVVKAQADAGIDCVNDGEQGRANFATYIRHRITGYGAEVPFPGMLDDPDFPEFQTAIEDIKSLVLPACDGPLEYRRERVEFDIGNLAGAAAESGVDQTFMSSVSPGEVTLLLPNRYYPSDDEYLDALVATMREEYEAIYAAGHILQLDAPDLALGFDVYFRGISVEEFRRRISMHVDALNEATANIPAEAMRMHICYGPTQYHHTRDIELHNVLDIVLRAKPAGLSFEAANCRHEHDWRLFEDGFKLPEGKYLIPGVIDVTINRVEHPEVVAERIVRLARVVGRENVIAGTDCGFAVRAGTVRNIAPSCVWAKLRSLTEGARLASERLWTRS